MAARKESGAERKSGKVRIRSTRSSGMSGIVDAVSGEGRTGLAGLVSTLKDRIRDRESGIGAPLLLNGELPPPRPRLIAGERIFKNVPPCQFSYVCFPACRPSSRSARQM